MRRKAIKHKPTASGCAIPGYLAVALFLSFPIIHYADAMNMNLPVPYADKCSPPQTPDLAFYSPDSETLLFHDEPIVEIICQAGVRSVGMTWTLHRNTLQKPFREGTAEALPANRFKIRINTDKLPPGFYDLRVKLDCGMPKPVEGVCVFGWKPEKMAIRDTRPADFQAFWDKALKQYSTVPLDPRIEGEAQDFDSKAIDAYNIQHAALPANYDPQGCKYDEVESWKISFAGPDGGRVYGWLAKPRGKGPFPAMLVLPGAGFGARPRPLEHARHGYIALDIQIHGQDVDLPKYDPIPGYNEQWVFDPPEKFYFYNVYLRAARAVDYLASLPEVNNDEIVAVGGSQGGRLGIIVAALNPKVRAVVSCIANSPNDPYRRWAMKCNGMPTVYDKPNDPAVLAAAKSDGMDLHGAPPAPEDAAGRCWAYYDPMNFAPDVHCPVLMNAGLIDPVSPPYSTWAVFLRLASSHKKMIPLPGLAHDWSAEFDREAWQWVNDLLQ